VSIFGAVADLYDAARPGYPNQVFDALGPIEGRTVIDIGAGTGIATDALLARGAKVIAVDVSPQMLARAKSRNGGLIAVVSDGARLPVRDASTDCACFAQAWHWMDPVHRVQEVARILRAGGLWAAWWSQPRADGETWFERFWEIIESSCEGIHRQQRDANWGQELIDSELFDLRPVAAEPWTRYIDVRAWLMDLRTQSFIAALDEQRQVALLNEVEGVADQNFPDGRMVIAYDTTLWSAIRR
jgi:SAM-dependent methyltransferase